MADPQYKQIDKYDRMIGAIAGMQDVTKTAPTTIAVMSPLVGEMQTFIIQTFRQAEHGDTISLQYLDGAGSVRIAIPPSAAAAIARQRDALTTKVRKNIGKRTAAARKARGELPGFMKGKKGKP